MSWDGIVEGMATTSRSTSRPSTARPSISRGSASHLSTSQGAALYIGAVLGTGVIALPGIAARTAGPASLLAWVGLVVCSVPMAATFAALGARYPDSGGVSTYVRRAFGTRPAAITGWWFYFAVPCGVPAAAIFGGSYVATAVGGGRPTVLVTATGLVLVVIVANTVGLRMSGRLQLILAGVLVLLLTAAVVLSLPDARVANLHPFAPHGWTALVPAMAVLVWAFTGWEAVTSLAGEFAEPRRDLRRATTVAVVVIGVLYLAVAVASVAVLGPSAGHSDAPLALLLARGLGGSAKVLAAVAAVVLTLGTMNAYVAGGAKLGAALGRDGALPRWLTRGSGPGEVPRRSLAVLAGLSLAGLGILAVSGADVRPLLLATTSCVVSVYVVATAAAVRLLDRGSLGRRTAMAAFAFVLVLVAVTGWYLAWPVLLAGAATCYLRRSDRNGQVGRPRWDGVVAGSARDARPTAAILSTARSPHH